jgi:glucose/arabinose dehydrogenase
LAVDDQGNLYVARRGARWVARVDPSGMLSVLTSNNDVGGLATDALGALLISDVSRGEILRFSAGQVAVIASGLDRPTSLVVAPDRAIVVLAEGSADLLRIVLN